MLSPRTTLSWSAFELLRALSQSLQQNFAALNNSFADSAFEVFGRCASRAHAQRCVGAYKTIIENSRLPAMIPFLCKKIIKKEKLNNNHRESLADCLISLTASNSKQIIKKYSNEIESTLILFSSDATLSVRQKSVVLYSNYANQLQEEDLKFFNAKLSHTAKKLFNISASNVSESKTTTKIKAAGITVKNIVAKITKPKPSVAPISNRSSDLKSKASTSIKGTTPMKRKDTTRITIKNEVSNTGKNIAFFTSKDALTDTLEYLVSTTQTMKAAIDQSEDTASATLKNIESTHQNVTSMHEEIIEISGADCNKAIDDTHSTAPSVITYDNFNSKKDDAQMEGVVGNNNVHSKNHDAEMYDLIGNNKKYDAKMEDIIGKAAVKDGEINEDPIITSTVVTYMGIEEKDELKKLAAEFHDKMDEKDIAAREFIESRVDSSTIQPKRGFIQQTIDDNKENLAAATTNIENIENISKEAVTLKPNARKAVLKSNLKNNHTKPYSRAPLGSRTSIKLTADATGLKQPTNKNTTHIKSSTSTSLKPAKNNDSTKPLTSSSVKQPAKKSTYIKPTKGSAPSVASSRGIGSFRRSTSGSSITAKKEMNHSNTLLPTNTTIPLEKLKSSVNVKSISAITSQSNTYRRPKITPNKTTRYGDTPYGARFFDRQLTNRPNVKSSAVNSQLKASKSISTVNKNSSFAPSQIVKMARDGLSMPPPTSRPTPNRKRKVDQQYEQEDVIGDDIVNRAKKCVVVLEPTPPQKPPEVARPPKRDFGRFAHRNYGSLQFKIRKPAMARGTPGRPINSKNPPSTNTPQQ
jgi:hypothetical protein